MNNPEAVIDGLSIPVVNMRRRSATFSSLPWWWLQDMGPAGR